jgi:hypothetical protein
MKKNNNYKYRSLIWKLLFLLVLTFIFTNYGFSQPPPPPGSDTTGGGGGGGGAGPIEGGLLYLVIIGFLYAFRDILFVKYKLFLSLFNNILKK